MLITNNKVMFVDWDDIMLADPMRDIGPILWWYLPEDSWKKFIELCGISSDDLTVQKIYWFASRSSLEVALWHLEKGWENDNGFLTDFIAAANAHPNRRMS